ncbi:Gfo/Idh/MocA family protein [Propionicicella superfundia]|uniref:Gfo/Idh/MocA family protein n=1 Tax=Propionicicella superfundia TaxID=348582 RepID=UPI00041B64C5|nr:Gfo/Idh/MocA family oxidoreductase [Propionicicella superfundia]
MTATDPVAPLLAPAAAYPDPAEAPGLRWGILAAGGIAHRFATEIPRHTASTIAAVGSRSLDRARAFAREMDVARAYGSYEELVADPGLDAIYIASPHSEHRDHALLALQAGKPVLVEKAFARSAAEAREVFAAAQSRGLFAMEAMWSRFLPHYRSVVAAVRGGLLGEIVAINAQHGQHLVFGPEHRLWNPRLAGGALLDLAVYPLSFAHALLGKPDEIHAFGSLTDRGVDSAETIVLRHGPVTLTVAQASMLTGMANAATISGTDGRIDIERTFYNPSDAVLTLHDGRTERLAGRHAGGFQYEAAEVARRIAAGETQSPLMTWQDTMEVMEIMDEVRRRLGVAFPGE